MCEEWGLLDAVEMVCHDNASNMMGMYNIVDFPNECIPGRCICHLLQLIIKVVFGCNRKMFNMYCAS